MPSSFLSTSPDYSRTFRVLIALNLLSDYSFSRFPVSRHCVTAKMIDYTASPAL
jgi:hypothetical protein